MRELDGVEAWCRLHVIYNRRALGRMFRVQQECMSSKVAKDIGHVKHASMQWEETWKNMMTELGSTRIFPVFGECQRCCRFSPRTPGKLVLVRLDEIENITSCSK